jgi:5,10-methylenetetrahydromethanopterin reductase
MDIGISLPTPADPSAIVADAEERGFHSAWLYDSQMLYADLFIGMGLAAKATKRIRIGSGVLVPSNRIAPVTATCLATLNRLAPGRIDFGIGTGYTARRTMGQGAVPLSAMFEQIRVIQELLANHTVEWQAEGKTHKIRYLNPEIGMVNLDDPVRVHVSAMGPVGRRRTAALDAGWLTVYSGMSHTRKDLADMNAAWRAASKDPAGQYSTCFAWGCVLEPGEPADSPRAKAQAGNYVAASIHNFMEFAEHGGTGIGKLVGESAAGALGEAVEKYRRLYASYTPSDAKYLTLHRGHVLFLREDEEPIINAELMRRYTLTGTEDEVAGWVRDLADAGYGQVTMQITPGTEADAMDGWTRVAERVGPATATAAHA